MFHRETTEMGTLPERETQQGLSQFAFLIIYTFTHINNCLIFTIWCFNIALSHVSHVNHRFLYWEL